MIMATNLKRGSRKKQGSTGPLRDERQLMPPPPPPPQQPQLQPQQQMAMMMMMPPQAQQQQPPRPHPPPPPPPQMHPDQTVRRTQSQRQGLGPDHVELTKKNYRLAKELSELRVRHREECKNVTRLTMENMNLASRCREAITHAAMLKKELAMHQKRAQEALRFQREQTQRMASNLSADLSRLSHSFESGSSYSTPDRKTEIERLLSNITPPPPPPPPPRTPSAAADPPEQKSTQPDDLTTDAVVSSDEDDTVEDTLRGRSVLDVVESLSESPQNVQLRVFSTPNRNRKEDRWTPHIDAAPGEHDRDPEGKSLHPQSPSRKVGGSTMRHQKYNEEFPSDIMPQSGSTAIRKSSQKHLSEEADDEDDHDDEFGIPSPTKMGILDRHSGMITLNSIDAFEASFDTTFPSTFSQARSSKDSPTTEIYNPFAPSPARSVGRSAPPTPPSHANEIETSPEVIRITNTSSISPFATPTSHHSNGSGHNSRHYETPPKDRPSSEGTPFGEPSRPHKTASAEARARYQKALQPRGSHTNGSQSPSTTPHTISSDDEVEVPRTGGFQMPSPSSLLKRIQDRRKHKEQGSAPESSLMQENFEPRGEETHEQYQDPGTPEHQSMLGATKTRRSVKQPISYAEPALNIKIRQGHSYFPKSDEPRIVTPEQVIHFS